MIKIVSNGAGQIDYYDHPEFTWTYPGNFGVVNVVHNKGKRPDHILVACKVSGVWTQSFDVQNNGAPYGWAANADGTSTLNNEKLYLYYHPFLASTPCRIRLLFLAPGALNW